ncbi:MAG: hypothetical protein U0930_00485 [Pirellulales bacterium]
MRSAKAVIVSSGLQLVLAAHCLSNFLELGAYQLSIGAANELPVILHSRQKSAESALDA